MNPPPEDNPSGQFSWTAADRPPLVSVPRATLMLTPMIDIVFQLIAFFIFALNFEALSVKPQIQPPPWSEPVPDMADVLRPEVVFEIDEQGRLLSGQESIALTQETGRAKLEELIQDVPVESRIILRADQRMMFREAKLFLQLCRQQRKTAVELRLREPLP